MLTAAEPVKGRIAFHTLFEFHHAILDPIHALMEDRTACLMSRDIEAVIAFKPKVLVIADSHYSFFRERLPGTIIVWTRHGFSSGPTGTPKSTGSCVNPSGSWCCVWGA